MKTAKYIIIGVLIAVIAAIVIAFMQDWDCMPGNESTTKEPNEVTDDMVALSLSELVEWYRGIDTDLQASMLAEELYYGKDMKVSGIIEEIEPWLHDEIKIEMEKDGIEIDAYFKDPDKVVGLLKNMEIEVLGQLFDVGHSGVVLVDCSLVSTSR